MTEITAIAPVRRKIPFSPRAFGVGLGASAVFWLLMGGYAALHGTGIAVERQAKLATQTVAIMRPEGLPSSPPEDSRHVERSPENLHENPPENSREMFGPPAPPHADTPEGTIPARPQDDHEPQHHEANSPAPSPHGESAAAPHGPVEGLYEDTVDGRLPKIRAGDGLTPFNAYKRPFAAATAKASIVSIVMMNMGISDRGTEAALTALPLDVSAVISPYAQNPDFWSNEARAAGREIWIELPVETDLYPMDDPGPQTLMIGAVEKQNLAKLYWTLSRTSGYAGLVTGYQTALMRSDSDARPILDSLYARGLAFVDGEPQPNDMAATMAGESGGYYAHNNIWIDTPPTAEHIALSLQQLEILAQGNGSSIGFINAATPMGLKMIQDWIKTLPEKGIVLAPLSAQAGLRK